MLDGLILKRLPFSLIGAIALIPISGCGDEGGSGELDLAACDPDRGPFTLEIDNPFFPLLVGHELVLEGEEDGTAIRVEITVLDETEVVAGVTTRVVEEAEYEDDEVVEISRNFFVQASGGTVCYYGEDVDDYEDGEIVGHEGAWRAGEGSAEPGIIMPGSPAVGMEFAQERAPGVADDRSAVVGTDEAVSVPAGDFEHALHLVDWNPLEGQTMADGEDKMYALDIGLVVDDVVELVSYSPGE